MIYHYNRFTLKPGVSDAERDAALEGMHEMSRVIPSVKSRLVGRDFGGEYEYAAVTLFEDLEGYEEYMNHPAHLEVDRIGLPLVDKFMSSDVTDDPDPEFGAKIAQIHHRRYANKPEIAGLVSDLGEYSGAAAPGDSAS